MNSKPEHPIRLVTGSQFCQFTIIENKLKTISENQRVLYDEIVYLENLLHSRT